MNTNKPKRFEYIVGLGIHDTTTDEYYITPQEILWLVNHLDQLNGE